MSMTANCRKSGLRNLLLLTILATLGACFSVPIGYAGGFLNSLAVFPLALPQLLSGLHVLWIMLARLLVPQRGSAVFVGGLKGLVESSLFSHLGVFAFVVSLLEGVIVEMVLVFSKRGSTLTTYAAGGLSSASNLLVVQFLFLPALSLAVYVLGYFAAFVSGVVFAGYLGTRVYDAVSLGIK